jgi:phosphatidate cytidylyltransferase
LTGSEARLPRAPKALAGEVPGAPLGAQGGGGHQANAPGYRAVKFNLDWITRPLFGIALIGLAIGAIVGGPLYIAIFAALAGGAAAREWHRMVGERVYGPAFFLTTLTVALALGAAVLWPHSYVAWAILAGGAVIAGVYAALTGHWPLWHAAGPLYIGVALVSLVLLRGSAQGIFVVIGMFVAIWAADTGALIIGNLVGGPRLWPALSPNKTWSGTVGAVATAAIVEAVYVRIFGGNAILGGALGAVLAVVAICGDLFESWVKRVFQRKDSGGMIPGHGGVLDRIDSTLFVAPLLALAVLVLGLDPLFGAHP